MSKKAIFQIVLEKDGSFTSDHEKVFYVRPNDVIRLTLSSKKILNQLPILLTSIETQEKNESKKLSLYSEIKDKDKIEKKEIHHNYNHFMGNFDIEGSWSCDITLKNPGSYFFQIIFVTPKDQKTSSYTLHHFGRPEWIIVQPLLKVNNHNISPQALIMQTMLSRCLGPIDRWEDIIKHETSLRYNAFHLTTLQKLSASDKHHNHCISDQLYFSEIFFPLGSNDNQEHFAILKEKLKSLESKYQCIFFIDIILNHTSENSSWLLELSSSYYSLENTPQLNSAYILDNAIIQFSEKLILGEIKEFPEPYYIKNDNDLDFLMKFITEKVIYPLNLYEYFLIDIRKCIQNFREYMITTHPNHIMLEKSEDIDDDNLSSIFTTQKINPLEEILKHNVVNFGHNRYGASLNFDIIAKYFIENPKKGSFDQLQKSLEKVNKQNEWLAKGYIEEAIKSIKNEIYHNKIQKGHFHITSKNPLIKQYFATLENGQIAAKYGSLLSKEEDLKEDIVKSMKFHYLRRNVIISNDLVSLNYGENKKHCPGLWTRMKRYIQQMALAFHGFRLCDTHGIQVYIMEYFARKARKVNPNLYIICEPFKSSKTNEAEYCKKIGINGLIREIIQVSNPSDLGNMLIDLTQRQKLISGSLEPYHEINEQTQEIIHMLYPRDPDPIFIDWSDTNQSYYQRKTIMDSLSIVGLLAMSNFFIGSTKGFDQLYPDNPTFGSTQKVYKCEYENLTIKELNHHNQEKHQVYTTISYASKTHANNVQIKGNWDNWQNPISLNRFQDNLWHCVLNLAPNIYEYKFIVDGCWICNDERPKIQNAGIENNLLTVVGDYKFYRNIMHARKQLNSLHQKISIKYPELRLNQITEDIIVLYRESLYKTTSYVLITRSAYKKGVSEIVNIVIDLPGIIKKYELICYMEDKYEIINEDKEFLTGIEARVVTETSLLKFADIAFDSKKIKQELRFFRMPPSFTCILKINLIKEQAKAIQDLNNIFSCESTPPPSFIKCISSLQAHEINYVLFSCDNEEKARTEGKSGVYKIPNYGLLPYAGFGSLFRIIRDVSKDNNLKHPLLMNLMEGDWLLDYLLGRICGNQRYEGIYNYVNAIFSKLKLIPRYLIPKYFSKTISIIRMFFERRVSNQNFVDPYFANTTFFKSLLLCAYQMIGDIPLSNLPEYSINIAAGLPYFSSGLSRCRSRDTFIAFKGIFLVTGLFKEAKSCILLYASFLRHGLIPNLLNSGKNPRYNSRDSVWWFIKAIADYIDYTKDHGILSEKISMRYLNDNQFEHERKKQANEQLMLSLEGIIHKIFQSHATGIKFREWNAGEECDPNISYSGFNIELELNESTGFIFGGNRYNCLTWMDKMGTSDKASNRSIPATPRDGAPIELTALLKACLDYVIKWKSNGYINFEKVQLRKGKSLYLKDWSALISANFEKHYWIPRDPGQFKDFIVNTLRVGRRGIYKDSYLSSRDVEDYYLRPNGCIAIAVAPSLFTSKEHVLRYLQQVEIWLINENSLGIKTLDSHEKVYNATYDEEDDSDKKLFAHGFSYHNGPEWVWLFGMFALAGIRLFGHELSFSSYMSYLTNHRVHIENTDWISLPELTNDNGTFCKFSCQAQACAIGTLLEAIHDAKKIIKY